MSKAVTDTQLTDIKTFNKDNIVFGSISEENIPKSTIKAKVIPIQIKNPNGSIGELIIPTPKCFSKGVSISKNQSGEENGYQMYITLYDSTKEGDQYVPSPTQEQKEWVNISNEIINSCKKYCVDKKNTIGKADLTMDIINSKMVFNDPFWYKTDPNTRVRVPNASPVLYGKLIVSKKKGNKILTRFTDFYDRDIDDPLTLLDQMCFVIAAVKFESIYVSNKISIRLKLYNVQVEVKSINIPKLLKSKIDTKVTESQKIPLEDDEDDIDVSDAEDKSEKEVKPEPKKEAPQAKQPIKRIIKRN